MRRAAMLPLCLLALSAALPAERSATLEQLMALLSQRQHGVADFEQTQYLALLKQPAHSSGVLRYEAPDHLEQRTLKPRPQTLVLDHDVLTLEAGGHRRRLRLQDSPQLAPLIDSVRATLAGDLDALERSFSIELNGDLEHWQLRLHPIDPRLSASVQSIQLNGVRDAVLQVSVQLDDGDRSVMKITPRE